jgi:hypothetical protein
MFLPIPLIGLFRLGKVGRAVFPAAWGIGLASRLLALMALLSLAVSFVSLIWIKDKPYAWQFPLSGMALMYLCFGLQRLCLWRGVFE